MFVRSRRTALLAVLVSASALVAAACGGSDSGGGSGCSAKPTKAQEASATKQIDINAQPRDKRQAGRHDPLGGRPVLDAVELQPAQRP